MVYDNCDDGDRDNDGCYDDDDVCGYDFDDDDMDDDMMMINIL